MIAQSGEDMIAVLPYRNRHDQRRLRWNGFEYIHTHTLVPDKTVFECFIIEMGPFNGKPLGVKCRYDLPLHICLCGPAGLVGGQTQISTRDEKYLVWVRFQRRRRLRNLIIHCFRVLSITRAARQYLGQSRCIVCGNSIQPICDQPLC